MRDGEVVAPDGGWVYVWREADGGVVHVGATRLHPAARAEKHLRDGDPSAGRIRARHPDPARAFTVVAVEIPPGARRAVVKAHVTWTLAGRGALSSRWCGERPAAPGEALRDDEAACAAALLRAADGAT